MECEMSRLKYVEEMLKKAAVRGTRSRELRVKNCYIQDLPLSEATPYEKRGVRLRNVILEKCKNFNKLSDSGQKVAFKKCVGCGFCWDYRESG
jgi:hypothetical protein